MAADPRVALASFAVLSTFAILACSSTEADPRPPTSFPVDARPPADTAPDGGGDQDADAEPVEAGCVAETGCWNCAPTTNAHFLNRCTSSQCAPFDDRARIPGWGGGALPPVP
jgi:hypothetical protein